MTEAIALISFWSALAFFQIFWILVPVLSLPPVSAAGTRFPPLSPGWRIG
jgi:hypothetical protein